MVYYKSGSQDSLSSLLGTINSFCFEFQLRSFLTTGHISSSASRKTATPSEEILSRHSELKQLATPCIEGCCSTESRIGACVTKNIYKSGLSESNKLLPPFDKVKLAKRESLLGILQYYD